VKNEANGRSLGDILGHNRRGVIVKTCRVGPLS